MPLRQSFAYPLRIAANGGLQLERGDLVTQDRIRSVIETRPREMPMRANYGLSDQCFTVIPSSGVIGERVRQAIELQVPDITPFVFVDDSAIGEGQITLEVTWQQEGGQLATAESLSSLTTQGNKIVYSIDTGIEN